MGTFINFFAGVSDKRDLPSVKMETILLNVPQLKERPSAMGYLKDVIRQSGIKWVLLDSGGFQIFSKGNKDGVKISFDPSKPLIWKKQELNIAPNHVINAAVELRPDIVMALDHPVLKTSDPEEQWEEFLKKRKRNRKWMIETSRLHQERCRGIDLYLPIQCYDLKQFSYFEKVLKNLRFDGLSLPTRNMKPKDIAEFFLKFHEMGIRKVHLLGIASFAGIALVAYFARNIFDRCSLDARSWCLSVYQRDYILPDSLLTINVGRKSTVGKKEKLICGCFRCRGKSYGDIVTLSDREGRAFLIDHNYHAIKKAGEDFYNHAGSAKKFENHLRKRSEKRAKVIDSIMEAISMIQK